MSYETEQGNVSKADAVISAIASPAFVESSKALAQGKVLEFPSNNAVLKFNKDGSFVAEITAESGTYSFDAGDEFSQTAVTCTAQKYTHIWKPTVEAERFSGDQIGLDKAGKLSGEALARKFDSTFIAQFPSITNLVTATADLTKDDLLDAQYTVHSAMNMDRRLHAMINRKARNAIRKELTSVTASAFSNLEMLSLVNQQIQPNGLVGEFADIMIFNTSGFTATGGDDQQCVYDPEYAFGIGVDSRVYSRSVFKASEGFFTEVATYMFMATCIWNNTAACELRSDT